METSAATGGAYVEIDRSDPRIFSAYVGERSNDAAWSSNVLSLVGHVRPAAGPPRAVWLQADRKVLGRTETFEARPHLEAHGDEPVGFAFASTLLATGTHPEIEVMVEAGDGSTFRFATISTNRRLVADGLVQPDLQPLLMTTTGRSGSTWLTRVLAAHPALTCYNPFGNDLRLASYWAQTARSLSRPAASMAPIVGGEVNSSPLWWAGSDHDLAADLIKEETVRHELFDDQVSALCQLGVDRTAAFYRAYTDGRGDVTHFVEKARGVHDRLLVQELFKDVRDFVLIRDPRDVFASILAFNAKRGVHEFGARAEDTPLEFFQRWKGNITVIADHLSLFPDTPVVRYEDLVATPHDSVEGLLRSLHLDAGDDLVDKLVEAGDGDSRASAHRTTPTREASVRRWEQHLTVDVVQAASAELRDELDLFGYED
ncbi:sulfotransferase [Euzebya rosea]|uniref:sulfotransferase n=1 Tax=Euzebya rosea TaxID=2052804 RepID=UPI001300AA2D|nr:sulfotransferase [Euzebya rosea]